MRRLMTAVLLAAAATPAAAQEDVEKQWSKMQPARGVYTLRQRGEPESGSDSVAMSGRMIVEAKLTCAEFLSTLTMDIRASSGGQTMTMKLEQKGSETRDGKIYRFSSVTYENGRESERREGQAVLQSRDGPGEAKIKGASNEDIKLEAGTVLPGTHILRMMAAAASGKKELEHRVFYGLDQMKITASRVTILGAGRSGKEKGLGEFADKPGWTIKEEHKDTSGGPDATSQTSEMFVTEDGVTTSLSLAIQGLELTGTALSIEKLPKPECK
jgi:hypothetical protein